MTSTTDPPNQRLEWTHSVRHSVGSFCGGEEIASVYTMSRRALCLIRY